MFPRSGAFSLVENLRFGVLASSMEPVQTNSILHEPFDRSFLLARVRDWALPAILLLVCFATLWFGLGACRLWDRDEPRNARCAIEMLERGDWVVPTFNGQLRTHKPILLYWLQIASIAVLGESDFTVRMASAIMATIAVFTTFVLGSRLIDPRTGFWSGRGAGDEPDVCRGRTRRDARRLSGRNQHLGRRWAGAALANASNEMDIVGDRRLRRAGSGDPRQRSGRHRSPVDGRRALGMDSIGKWLAVFRDRLASLSQPGVRFVRRGPSSTVCKSCRE